MTYRTLTCIAAIPLFIALAAPFRLAAQINYNVIEFGELGGTAGSANGINDRGWPRAPTTWPETRPRSPLFG